MQRKAALQAQLHAKTDATCGSNGAGTCPSCQCGSNTNDGALPTQQSRLLKIVLAALTMLALVGLVLQL